jgi:hypothetical protein
MVGISIDLFLSEMIILPNCGIYIPIFGSLSRSSPAFMKNMKRISRWLPTAPNKPLTKKEKILLMILGIGFMFLIYKQPSIIALLGVITVASILVNTVQNRKLRKLAEARNGESICSFARSYDLHNIDPYIVRAVYEELIAWTSYRNGYVPIRPTDTFEFYGIDGEDLDDLAIDVAFRSHRSMENAEANPLFGKVKTIDDLIQFISNQPASQQ